MISCLIFYFYISDNREIDSLLARLSQNNVVFVLLEAVHPSVLLHQIRLLEQKRYYLTLCSQEVTQTLLKNVSEMLYSHSPLPKTWW